MPRSALHLKGAILAGAATGMRASVAMAALIDDRACGLPTWLAGRPARAAASLAVIGELATDKLPSTPSRLEPTGLAGRATSAAFAGAVIARSTDQPLAPVAAVAAAAALVSAKVCHTLRVALSERLPSCAVAAGEDGLAVALAGAVGGDLP